MIVAIDFDGTLVELDTPLPGAKDALRALREQGHTIIIHTCNNVEWVQQVLNNNDMPYDSIWDKPGKPRATAYVDDRAVVFDGNWDHVVAALAAIDDALQKPLTITASRRMRRD